MVTCETASKGIDRSLVQVILDLLNLDRYVQEDAHEVLLRLLNQMDDESLSRSVLERFTGESAVRTLSGSTLTGERKEKFVDVGVEIKAPKGGKQAEVEDFITTLQDNLVGDESRSI
jgi:hypothetical protein